MSAEPLRVLLVSKFPTSYIEGTIAPKLRDIGIHVTRTVPVDYEGQLRDVDAVLFMFQMTSHVDHDNFKARCKAEQLPFVLLERQSANWPVALRKAGLKFSGTPIYSAPLIVANGKSLVPPPCEVKPPAPIASRPFTEGLRAERAKAGVTLRWIAATMGVSAGLVDTWSAGQRVSPEHYEALCGLFPALETYRKPEFTTRAYRRRAVPVVAVTPVELPLPVKATNGHKVTPPPLAGLLRAARALGIEGKLTVEVDDGASVVRVGAQAWHGTSPDAAVEEARASLDKRLAEAMRKMEEQRCAMQAAMAEIGGDHV